MRTSSPARPRLALLLAAPLACAALAPRLAFAEDPFTVTTTAASAKVGAAAVARLDVKPAAGYHINKEYPTSLKLVAPDGVELPKAKIGKTDAGVTVEEKAAHFEVPFTAKAAGKHVVTGTLSFAVCTDTTCDPRKAKVEFTVDAR